MILALLTAALAGPTYGLAETECELAGHSASLSCKKGVCVLEEELRYRKPDCTGEVRFAGGDEPVDPLVLRGERWAVAEPCGEGASCVEGVPHRARIRRVLGLGLDGALALAGTAELELGPGLSRSGSEARVEVRGKAPKKSPKLAVLPEAQGAVVLTERFGGPVDNKGLRDGVWLVPDPAGRPLVREIRYARGVRVDSGEWQARTRTDAAGRVLTVEALAGCPKAAEVETSLGAQLTQACTWTDEEGSHALVATYDLDPWQVRSVEGVLNGKRSGELRTWTEAGRLDKVEHYRRDKLVGIAERYHASGALSERIVYGEDSQIIARAQHAADGTLLEQLRMDVPGMGGQVFSQRFAPDGRLLEERVPLDAATAELRVREGDTFAVTVEERAWSPPATGCAADLDCPDGAKDSPHEGEVGLCDAGSCRMVPDPAKRLKARGDVALRDPAPLLAALREAVGGGRTAWVSPNLVGSDAHTCVEVAVGGQGLLPGPALSARTLAAKREEGGQTVHRWTELDLGGGLLAVHYRAAVAGEEGLEPYAAPDAPPLDLALSAVDARGAHYHLERYELEAVCAPLRSYAACPAPAEGSFAECASEALVIREASEAPPARLAQERPERVRACEVSCPPITCGAEAARMQWLLRDRAYARPHAATYSLWWTEAGCAASIGLR